ncbi:hypothetical protein K501DRAFT_315473 [Backusella circina FSU 941]|nr:hypothetical protein K501DRAFT_315473 [Backusella circina FSU 941]
MASFFFKDYQFPSEFYDRDCGDFTTPIRTLLDFTPHILQELPKKEEDQKSIHSDAEDSWTESFTSSTTSYINSLLNSPRTHALGELLLRCGNEYLKSRESTQQNNHHNYKFNVTEEETTSFFTRGFTNQNKQNEANKKDKKPKDPKTKKEKNEDDKQVTEASNSTSTVAKTAAAAGLLSISLFSTYQASVVFSDISFHNQLEILLTQVHAIIQSTEVWVQEHEKMDEKIPHQLLTDLNLIRDLVSHLERLDPRSNKKVEAAGWGCGAIGGLSALGAVAYGSATVMTGGAALVVGGAIIMMYSKAQSVGKGNLGARMLLENQAKEKIAESKRMGETRKALIKESFIKVKPKTENAAKNR